LVNFFWSISREYNSQSRAFSKNCRKIFANINSQPKTGLNLGGLNLVYNGTRKISRNFYEQIFFLIFAFFAELRKTARAKRIRFAENNLTFASLSLRNFFRTKIRIRFAFAIDFCQNLDPWLNMLQLIFFRTGDQGDDQKIY